MGLGQKSKLEHQLKSKTENWFSGELNKRVTDWMKVADGDES